MISASGITLCIYNMVLVHIIKRVKSIAYESETHTTLWSYIPIWGDYWSIKKLKITENSLEVPDSLIITNVLLNLAVLLPSFSQRPRYSLLLGIILMWNFFILQRMLAFLLSILCFLWLTDINNTDYIMVGLSVLIFNIFHIMLIIDTMKLQRYCLEATEVANLAQIETIGDGIWNDY
ncbi:uncharacterized protein LOC108599327 [Drosophila busckii]|uniref:uncharacterized protein LOC108599327 n=1 Tax=Drosophila busckii TaxID=30019 RepID=UPI00083ED48C|nr:uncharacterized protein LOC108599327 [Drosophila busckii]